MRNIINRIIEANVENSQFKSYDLDMFLGKNAEEFLGYMSNMKENELYKSPIHGLYHSEKVALFAYLIAKEEGLDEVDMQIIMDAAKYHDIGRETDANDTLHGLSSANRIERVLESPIYKNKRNLFMIKAIIDGHSTPDKDQSKAYDDYFYGEYLKDNALAEEEYRRFEKLYKILKDADALDRCRFSDNAAALDPSYLRLPFSRKLIPLSERINEIYASTFSENYNPKKVKGFFRDCVHGIGFDFFKIESILKNGVLSSAKLEEKGISGARNFIGGNSRNWISVVDATMLKDNESAFKQFIENGINFVCSECFLIPPVTNKNRSLAISEGLPYDKSGHPDEKYVRDEILPERIVALTIYQEAANKKIKEISFMYNSFSFDIFTSRIDYFIKNTNASENPTLMNKLEDLMFEYRQILNKYHSASNNNERTNIAEISLALTIRLVNINRIIQEMIELHYSSVLGIPGNQITVKDIVNYELKKGEIQFNNVSSNDEEMFFFNQKTI